MATLNLKRDYLTCKNKQSDYQRLVNLLRLNDIPRIHQLIKTCMNSGGSTKVLISKVLAAIDGKSIYFLIFASLAFNILLFYFHDKALTTQKVTQLKI